MNQVVEWRKVCYENYNLYYPDNYVDEKLFLDQFDTTIEEGSKASLLSMIINTSVVAEQTTAVTIFLTIFKYIVKNKCTLRMLIIVDVALIVVGYIVNRSLSADHFDLRQAIHTFTLFGIVLRIAAPVLQTLTASYSDGNLIFSYSYLRLILR